MAYQVFEGSRSYWKTEDGRCYNIAPEHKTAVELDPKTLTPFVKKAAPIAVDAPSEVVDAPVEEIPDMSHTIIEPKPKKRGKK